MTWWFCQNRTFINTEKGISIAFGRGHLSEALILNNRVYITFNQSTNKSFDLGAVVDVKGRCIGYDELLEWVKLDQAIVIK